MNRDELAQKIEFLMGDTKIDDNEAMVKLVELLR